MHMPVDVTYETSPPMPLDFEQALRRGRDEFG